MKVALQVYVLFFSEGVMTDESSQPDLTVCSKELGFKLAKSSCSLF